MNAASISIKIDKLYTKFRTYLAHKGVKLLLVPGLVTPAIHHGSSTENALQFVYTLIFNLLTALLAPCPLLG